MAATISFNPNPTTVGQGLFDDPSSNGLVQGTAFPDPATRFALRACILSTSETIPMWGGVGVYEQVPGAITAASPLASLGPICGRATALTGANALAGFSVFDQAYGMITSPQSPVPLAASGMQVMTYRLGSGARIAVACDPSLLDLVGGPISPQVSWDFVNQMLVPYASTTISSGTYPSAATISSGTYATLTGIITLTTNAAHGLVPGDTFTISAATGTGSFASINGVGLTAITGTAGSTLVYVIATNLTMTITGGNLGNVGVSITTAAAHGLLPGDTFEITSATGTNATTYLQGVTWVASAGTTGTTLNFIMVSGLTLTITGGNIVTGGLLPVAVLNVTTTNSQTVSYNSTTGYATWNFSGSCAVIQI